LAEHGWSYRSACPDYEEGILIVAGQDSQTDANIPVSFAMRWSGGRWDVEKLPFVANGIAVCPQSNAGAWIVGPFGHCAHWTTGAPVESRIDPSTEGPQYYGDITGIRCMDGSFLTFGMSRTAYRREQNRWIRVDAGVRTDDEDSDAGFTAVAGHSGEEWYAFGWDGEIWRNEKGAWHQVDSPTNIVFHGAVAASDGAIYACGQDGVIIRGRGDSWQLMEFGDVSDDFRDIVEFEKHIYVCSTKSFYRLAEEPTIEDLTPAVARSIGETPTFYRLASDGRRLWSVGRRHVITTIDCITWALIPPPPA
jgi:hypothetical protein